MNDNRQSKIKESIGSIVSGSGLMHLELFLLPLDEDFLFALESLKFDFLFSDELNGELTGLFYNSLIGFFFKVACGFTFDDVIEEDCAGVDIVGLKELFADFDFTFDDGVHFEFEDFSHHQFHLGSGDSFLDEGIRGDVEMRLVEVALSRIDC